MKKIDNRRFQDFIKAESLEGYEEAIWDWFVNMESVPDLKEKSRELWDSIALDKDLPKYDSDRIQDKIHHLLRLEEAQENMKNRFRKQFVTYLTRVAAVLLIPLAVFSYFHGMGDSSVRNEPAMAEFYSPLGGRTSFNLPDGTTGWLNGGSHLRFPSRFSGKRREVILTGEAYFDVEKDPSRPFIVLANGHYIEAVGTSFSVQSYPTEKATEVAVESGRVEIKTGQNNYRSPGTLLVLEAGDLATILNGTNICQKEKVNVDNYNSWTRGHLVLRNEPLSSAVRRINRWYNVKITIKDRELEEFRYRATFIDETLDEVLKLMSMSSPMRYKDLGREQNSDGTYGKRRIELRVN